MSSFSERYGYVKPVEVLHREQMSPELVKSLCSYYDMLEHGFHGLSIDGEVYQDLEKNLWVDFLHERYSIFEKLYAYTCQPDNGIRHALMDEDGKYVLGQEEAMFMLVSCSAFLNYLYRKLSINANPC